MLSVRQGHDDIPSVRSWNTIHRVPEAVGGKYQHIAGKKVISPHGGGCRKIGWCLMTVPHPVLEEDERDW
jgi:hypothetical protein